jgi:hypothetical protein
MLTADVSGMRNHCSSLVHSEPRLTSKWLFHTRPCATETLKILPKKPSQCARSEISRIKLSTALSGAAIISTPFSLTELPMLNNSLRASKPLSRNCDQIPRPLELKNSFSRSRTWLRLLRSVTSKIALQSLRISLQRNSITISAI